MYVNWATSWLDNAATAWQSMECMLKPLTVPEALEGLPATQESALPTGCPPGALRSEMQPGLTSEMEQPASSFCRVIVTMNLQKIILHKYYHFCLHLQGCQMMQGAHNWNWPCQIVPHKPAAAKHFFNQTLNFSFSMQMWHQFSLCQEAYTLEIAVRLAMWSDIDPPTPKLVRFL